MIADKLVCTLVREDVEMVAEMGANHHVPATVVVLVLAHRYNRVKIVPAHVHLPVKEVAVPHVQQDVKAVVNHHVQGGATLGARKVVIKDVKAHAIVAALVLAIRVVMILVRTVVKVLAKVAVRDLVRVIVTLVVSILVEEHVLGRAFMVVVGAVPTISQYGRKRNWCV